MWPTHSTVTMSTSGPKQSSPFLCKHMPSVGSFLHSKEKSTVLVQSFKNALWLYSIPFQILVTTTRKLCDFLPKLAPIHVCICAHTCMHMCVCSSVCVHKRGGRRTTSAVTPQAAFPLCFKTGSLRSLELPSRLDWLTDSWESVLASLALRL